MNNDSESDNEIQALKIKPTDKRLKENKTPKEKTEKQKGAWVLALAKRKENNELRKKLKEKEEAKINEIIQSRIVKKAVSIKKKEIRKQTVLDDISDDETPLEEINNIISRLPPHRKPNKPKPVQQKPVQHLPKNDVIIPPQNNFIYI